MSSRAQVESAMNEILTERANALAKATGAIHRQRKLTGAERLAHAGVWLDAAPQCKPGDAVFDSGE